MDLRVIDISAAAERLWLAEEFPGLEDFTDLVPPWDTVGFVWRMPSHVNAGDGELVPYHGPVQWVALVQRRSVQVLKDRTWEERARTAAKLERQLMDVVDRSDELSPEAAQEVVDFVAGLRATAGETPEERAELLALLDTLEWQVAVGLRGHHFTAFGEEGTVAGSMGMLLDRDGRARRSTVLVNDDPAYSADDHRTLAALLSVEVTPVLVALEALNGGTAYVLEVDGAAPRLVFRDGRGV
jgi:hypothetical protein